MPDADTSKLSWDEMHDYAAAAHKMAEAARAKNEELEKQRRLLCRDFVKAKDLFKAWSKLAELVHGKAITLPDLGDW